MPLRGHGVLAIWHAMTPDGDEEMIRWHNTEHVLERVSIPGFLRGRRYAHATRRRHYLDFYETESAETIASPPYLARLNEPTPWTQRVLPHFRDTFRIGCRVAASAGRGQGGAMLTMRLRPAEGRSEALSAWLTGPALELCREPASFVGAHVLETVPRTTQIRTAEGRLKGGEVTGAEEPWPLVLVVECSEPDGLDALVTGALRADRLASAGAAPEMLVGTYRFEVSLDPP